MALKSLSKFTYFSMEDFLEGKVLIFVKALPWNEGEGDNQTVAGSKVVVQIIQDETEYPREDISNFGEQLTVKVRGVAHTAYSKLRPLNTVVIITNVEKATVYGDYKNQLSLVANVEEANNEAEK